MDPLLDKIVRELSLWKPQRLALIKLHSTLSSINLQDDVDTIKASLPGTLNFDTTFPSFTFDMATGTGKTRLMAAAIAYLNKKDISRNFFILTPGQTIYEKTIRNFTLGSERYEFSGWSDIPHYKIVTGENYEHYDPKKLSFDEFTVFIFNVQKFAVSEKESRKFHSFREYLGAAFSDILKELNDLVLLMDESHHYRAEITKEAIADLHPILGLEFTATPKYRRNIIYSYSLGDAVQDRLVKRLQAIIRRNDSSYEEELEELKLRDGLNLHNRKKAILESYCKNKERDIIRPITLIICKARERGAKRNEHLERIYDLLNSDDFMDGYFKGKISVDYAERVNDESMKRIVDLEKDPGNTEILIIINKNEGWDIRNIYTIIPLRQSVSMIFTEQTLGRGVRLPFYDVALEEIEEEPDVFTLDVVSYKLGASRKDLYKEVIDAAHRNHIITKDYDEDEEKDKQLVTCEIKPDNPKYKIDVPKVRGKVKITSTLSIFEITPTYEELKEIHPELVGIDIIEETERGIGEAEITAIEGQVNYLISKLIEEVPELSYKDKDVVVSILSKYMEKATKGIDKNTWEELLKGHRRLIFEDMKSQIQEEINKKLKIDYFPEVELFEFRSYSATVENEGNLENPIPKKKSKIDVYDEEIKRTVVTNYEKTLYSENTFDTKQEKWLADILHRDDTVKKWIRNQKQFGIGWKFGLYHPDFIVEKEAIMYIVEVKARDEINDEDVKEKAQAAKKWCEEVSKFTKQKWEYKLIPHDQIRREDSFEAIIQRSVKI